MNEKIMSPPKFLLIVCLPAFLVVMAFLLISLIPTAVVGVLLGKYKIKWRGNDDSQS